MQNGLSQDLDSFVGSFKSVNDDGLCIKISKTRKSDYFFELSSKELYRIPNYYGFIFCKNKNVFCIINQVSINEYLSDSVYYTKEIYDGLQNGQTKIMLKMKDKNLSLNAWGGESCRICYNYTLTSKENKSTASFKPKLEDIPNPVKIVFKTNGYLKTLPTEKYNSHYKYKISESALAFEFYNKYLLVGFGGKNKIQKYGWVHLSNIEYIN